MLPVIRSAVRLAGPLRTRHVAWKRPRAVGDTCCRGSCRLAAPGRTPKGPGINVRP